MWPDISDLYNEHEGSNIPWPDITGFDSHRVYQESLERENPLEYIDKRLDRTSKYFIDNIYDLYTDALATITYVAELRVNRDTPQDNPYYVVEETEDEIINRYKKSNLILTYTGTIIWDILRKNFFNRRGQLDENYNYITKINIPEKAEKYDFCYIENNKIFWFGQIQQLGIAMYYLNQLDKFKDMSIELMIERLIGQNFIKIIKGQWSSVRTKALEVQSDMNEINNKKNKKFVHPFEKDFNRELALNLILEFFDKQ